MLPLLSFALAAEVQPVRMLDRPLTLGASVFQTNLTGDLAMHQSPLNLQLGAGVGLGRNVEIGFGGVPLAVDQSLPLVNPQFYVRAGAMVGPVSVTPQLTLQTGWPLKPEQLDACVPLSVGPTASLAIEVDPGLSLDLATGEVSEWALPAVLTWQLSEHLYSQVGPALLLEASAAREVVMPLSAVLGVSVGHRGQGIADLTMTATLPEAVRSSEAGMVASSDWELSLKATGYFAPID